MICPYCGAEINDGSLFCSNCGASFNQNNYQVPNNFQTPFNQAADELANLILGFGIAALACALTGCLSFLGIIFGALAMSKSKLYISQFGPLFGKSSAGRGLGIAGLVIGIIATASALIAIFAVGCVGCFAAASLL